MTKRTRHALVAAVSALVGTLIATPAHAGLLLWDANGTGVDTGGTGTWNSAGSPQLWRDGSVGGSLVKWSNGNQALLGGVAGTVTVADNISLDKNFQILTGGYTLRSDTGARTLTVKEAGSEDAIFVSSADNGRVFFGSLLAGNALALVGTNTTSAHRINIADGDSLEVLNDATTIQVTKVGNGALVFSNANKTYTGTTVVTAGSLLVNATHVNNAAGAYTVNASLANTNATLGGTGNIVRALTVQGTSATAKGIVNPGDPSIGGGLGTLTLGSAANTKVVTFANHGRLAIEVNGASADRLTIFGDLDLDNSTGEDLVITAVSPTAGKYTLVSYTGTLSSAAAANGFNTVSNVPANYRFINDTTNKTMDLQHRAVQAFTLTSPATVDAIVGGSIAVSGSLANTAPTGGSALAVALTGAGGLSSSAGATVAAGSSSTVNGTVSVGTTAGTGQAWQVTNTDANATASTSSIGGVVNVFEHSNASFSATNGAVDEITVDFGIVQQGSTQQLTFDLFNYGLDPALTAGLDLTGIGETDVDGVFSSDLALFTDHAAGSTGRTYTVTLDTTGTGTFTGVYTLALADEDLPGGTGGQTLKINLEGVVVAVPEPATLMALAAGGLLLRRRRLALA